MAETMNVNFRLDKKVKEEMEAACNEMGLSMSCAFTIFAKKVAREKRIPFEISVESNYSEESLKRLLEYVSRMEGEQNIEKDLAEYND